ISRVPYATKLFCKSLLSITKAMGDVQKKLQDLSDSYQNLQGELSTAVEARQKLESQQQENATVKKEFDILDDDANIYKQIGPVLLKQDKTEAVMAVNGRLEFIDKDIKRIEKQIKDIQDKAETVKTECSPRDTTIKLSVGEKPEIFNVHEGLIAKSSEFFERVMKPEWMEQRSDPYTIDLTDDVPETATLYVQWLYTGTLTIEVPNRGVDGVIDYKACRNAYAFGEKILDIAFKNVVLCIFMEVREETRKMPDAAVIDLIYACTPEGSSLRRFLSNLVAASLSKDPTWITYIDQLPREALVDTCKAIAVARSGIARIKISLSNDKYLESRGLRKCDHCVDTTWYRSLTHPVLSTTSSSCWLVGLPK
ncbi:hypothetical protein EK21DRAFT_76196, partial [Setomelanomma holmii]